MILARRPPNRVVRERHYQRQSRRPCRYHRAVGEQPTSILLQQFRERHFSCEGVDRDVVADRGNDILQDAARPFMMTLPPTIIQFGVRSGGWICLDGPVGAPGAGAEFVRLRSAMSRRGKV